jgi:hypothetical protein
VETGCREGQGSPRAAAPTGRQDDKLYKGELERRRKCNDNIKICIIAIKAVQVRNE